MKKTSSITTQNAPTVCILPRASFHSFRRTTRGFAIAVGNTNTITHRGGSHALCWDGESIVARRSGQQYCIGGISTNCISGDGQNV